MFSTLDIIGVLTDSPQPKTYWAKMKERDMALLQPFPFWEQLKMLAPDGKMRETDCANTEGILRIIQLIPSPKAEPLKRWLAKVGYERIQEIKNPELATKRTRLLYKLKGYSEDWIEKRMRGIAIREELREKKIFTPGNTKPLLFQCQGAKIGVGICYDYMFPEYWRYLALRGADIFCNLANFVFDYGFTLMRARALENGVFSVCVNRIGVERGQVFKGGSEIVDTRGNILIKAGERKSVKIIDIDYKKARSKKWNRYNDLLADRRPDIYS